MKYIVGPPTPDHLALWDHLMACGGPYGMEFSSTRAMTIRRIEGGILGNLTDITPDMTPFEAGLAPFVDMEKGDFIGRDALARKRYAILLVWVHVPNRNTDCGQYRDGW
jgi:aminomethyltransferase